MSSNGKANAALAAALIFLFLSSASAYLAFSRLYTTEGWVRHTRDVQSALAQFAMTTARAGRLRAEYVDSGDPALLDRQAEVINQVRLTLTSLQRLTGDNEQQEANCKSLAYLTEQRIMLINQAIELKRSGKSTLTAQAAMTRQIVDNAADTDDLMQRMYTAEEQLLSQRESRLSRSSTAIAVILTVSLFLALILFVVHHRLLVDQVAARARAETAQRALSARLLNVQDVERRKFARELHDSVGQHLAALKMAISILQKKLPVDPILQDCLKLLDDSIAETRTISHLLHPPLLDEAGLNSACRWFVEGFANRSGIAVDLEIDDRVVRLPEEVELALFRVLQESLTNVHRHSGAKRADVSLRAAGNQVTMRVKDYGHGMPPAVLQNLREHGTGAGVGFAGMTERIREIGGRLQVHSNATGTEIEVVAPARQRSPEASIPPSMEEVKK